MYKQTNKFIIINFGNLTFLYKEIVDLIFLKRINN